MSMQAQLEAIRAKLKHGSDEMWLLEEHERLRLGTQLFFETLAKEMRRPHFGDQAKAVLGPLLVRAQEAKLYTPVESL